MTDYDLVVIGGGNTGLSASYGVAAAGRRVALVDRGPVGGLCSLAGCNPKMIFARATEVLDEVRRAGEHGIRTGEVSIDWRKVWRRKKSFTDPVPAETEASLKNRGIELIRGEARFLGPDRIAAGERVLTAEGFVVATGSHPRRLDFPGHELVRTSDDVLEIAEPPARMAIIGSGVVAFELGQVFARVGTKVTILMRHGRALSNYDEDFVEGVLRFTEGLGVEFWKNTEVRAASRAGNAVLLDLQRAGRSVSMEADFVLNAAGRVAAIEALDLSAAGVAWTERGVTVDEYLRSPDNRRVFAGGDAHGERELSPVASYEGRVIARNFLKGNAERVDYSRVPSAVFTMPPLACVGLTEQEARSSGRPVEVASNDMTAWKVFAMAGEPVARAKVVAEKGTGLILGAQLFESGAAENIHIFALAMRAGMTTDQFRELVFVYPTFSSALSSTVPGSSGTPKTG